MASAYCGNVIVVDKPWGNNFEREECISAIRKYKPNVVWMAAVDTSVGAVNSFQGLWLVNKLHSDKSH